MLNKRCWTLTTRQLCDCEMILDGSFYPLTHFMNESDYYQVLKNMRFETGQLFPIPIVLDVNEEFSKNLELNEQIILQDKEGFTIANMTVESIWKPNLKMEAQKLYKTTDKLHPAVNFLSYSSNKVYLGGKIEEVMMPNHYDYEKYRLGPKDVKNKFKKMGWENYCIFQTRNPLHKAHVEMTFRSMKKFNANLLIHPVVGQTKAGDIDHHTRIRCYEHVIKNILKTQLFWLYFRFQ